MFLADLPGNDVMDININMATSWDGATMASLYKYPPSEFYWNWYPIIHNGLLKA
jgi:hypothetical protein